jgi:hypothetical protein
MAYLDGRLDEVAIDRYAQADDGSVWYLGEDVFDYRNGVVAITEGTWLAGKEGPPAMITVPKAGQVFRPENVIGIVFEEVEVEVEVEAIGKTVAGPRGPVGGAIVTQELHLDGTFSHKTFAPGYGEFSTGSGDSLEALALAVPTDALPGPVPSRLSFLSTSATGILESARVRDWEAVSTTLRRMNTAWKALRASNPPPRVAARMNDGLTALARLDRTGRQEIDARLRGLRAASDARNLPAAADHAARLGARVRDLAGHHGAPQPNKDD